MGPFLDIKGRSQLDLVAQLDVELGLKYHLDNVGFKLGSGDDGQAGGVTTKDSRKLLDRRKQNNATTNLIS
jgi:hypothetical protein